MNYEQDLEQLRERLRDFDRKADSSRWLMRPLRRKLAHFPRDVLRKLRRSIQKRRRAAAWRQLAVPSPGTGAWDAQAGCPGQQAGPTVDAGPSNAQPPQGQPPVLVCEGQRDRLLQRIETQQDARDFFADMASYKYADLMRQQVAA